jgi:hypothetical protein
MRHPSVRLARLAATLIPVAAAALLAACADAVTAPEPAARDAKQGRIAAGAVTLGDSTPKRSVVGPWY